MRFFWKIFISSVISSTVILFFFLFVISNLYMGILKKQTLEKNRYITELLQKELNSGFLNREWPYESLQKLSSDKDCLFWWIATAEEEIYLANEAHYMGRKVSEYFSDRELQDIENNVFNRSNQDFTIIRVPIQKGSFWLCYSLESVKAINRKLFFYVTGVYLLSVLCSGGVFFILIQHFIKPIQSLCRNAIRVGKGDLDVSVPVVSGDEIGNLARAFNQMIENLKESMVSRQYVEDILASLNDLLFVTDAEGIIQTTNTAAAVCLGIPGEKLIGKPLTKYFSYEILIPSQDSFTDFLNYLDQVRASEDDLYMTALNGTKIPVLLEYTVEQTADHGIRQVIFTVKDILSLREVEKEKEKFRQQLYQAQKIQAVGQLAGGVAHDFNNLLMGIIGNVCLAEKTAAPNAKKYLQHARKAADRATHLIRQLLAFSRNQEMEFKQVNVCQVIDEVVGFVRETMDSRIMLVNQTAANLPMVIGDSSQIHAIVMNLLINARDSIYEILQGKIFPERQQDHFCIRIEVSPYWDREYKQSYALISVSDNGTGMREETKERVFEPFFTTKEVGQGSGLGLASTYGIVQQHQGRIKFESEWGSGTRFSIYLPLASEQLDPIASLMEFGNEPPLKRQTILVVDDEELILQVVRETLESHQYQVLAAQDGREGLEIFSSQYKSIDLVIMDLSMPNVSGQEALRKMSAIQPDCRVILCSGYAPDQVELRQNPAVKYFLAKPYSPAHLIKVVRAVLDGAEALIG
jgi:PAS domain S-box-containing protein